jgi:hypothetical protein
MLNENEVEVVETEDVEDNATDYETDSETESDATETKAPEQKGTESLEDKRARLARQLERIDKKLGVEPKGESKSDSQKTETSNLQERLDRQELKIAGITDKKEQAEVLSLAKKLELDVEDAVSHPAIKAVLKDMRNKAATPASSSRTSSGSRDEVAYWASQTLKGGKAPTAELRTKVREYLAKNK